MPEYQFAIKNGEIITADYNRTMALNNDVVKAAIQEAFESLGETAAICNVSDELSEIYMIEVGKKKYYVCAKGTTPGGRDNLMDEQRIQQKAKYLNYTFELQKSGNKAISLGVYKKDSELIFCAWRLSRSNAASEDTPISKQIKIHSIAKAIKEGFVQQDKGHGEYACAFRKEFIYFYLNNYEWLHTGHVSELAEHTRPESEESIARNEHRYSFNRILFGAPGTGKSFRLNRDSRIFDDRMERVTFHPNYSYAQFVGTYKPIQGDGETEIRYKYVPGPFMRIYTEALNHPENNYLLLIEEINRANVAAVFGDVFQLLDRENGISEYSIATSEDIKKHLHKELFKDKAWEECSVEEKEKCLSMKLPKNMFIWATMNSADQGVFPMDTAFKRRWEFEYIGVDAEESEVEQYIIPIGMGSNRKYVKWNELRTHINNILTSDDCKVNEDKLLGPFFMSKNMLENALIDEDKFIKAFESKVIMYLFEDAMKMRPNKIFRGHEGRMIFSEICKTFEEKGERLFGIDGIEYINIEEQV